MGEKSVSCSLRVFFQGSTSVFMDFAQVVSLCVRSNLLEGEGVEFGEGCTARERKGQ